MCPHLLNVQIAGLLEAILGAPVGRHPLDLFLASPIGFNVVAVFMTWMSVSFAHRSGSVWLLYRRFP